MTRALMPGRWNHDKSRAVPDHRNCYMTDEEVAAREYAVMAFERVEHEHNLPAFVWWLIVSVVGVGGFVAGIVLGRSPL